MPNSHQGLVGGWLECGEAMRVWVNGVVARGGSVEATRPAESQPRGNFSKPEPIREDEDSLPLPQCLPTTPEFADHRLLVKEQERVANILRGEVAAELGCLEACH